MLNNHIINEKSRLTSANLMQGGQKKSDVSYLRAIHLRCHVTLAQLHCVGLTIDRSKAQLPSRAAGCQTKVMQLCFYLTSDLFEKVYQ